MNTLFERIKALLLKPRETWAIIKSEPAGLAELMVNYAAPLALIPVVARVINLALIGFQLPGGHISRAPLLDALFGGVVSFLFNLAGLLAAIWVVNWLAPYCESKPDLKGAAQLVLYSMTPVWLLGACAVSPILGLLQVFGLYGIYLAYLGLPIIIGTPQERVAWFTTLLFITSLAIGLVFNVVVDSAVYGPIIIRMMVY
jgi:hypothetical protein